MGLPQVKAILAAGQSLPFEVVGVNLDLPELQVHIQWTALCTNELLLLFSDICAHDVMSTCA